MNTIKFGLMFVVVIVALGLTYITAEKAIRYWAIDGCYSIAKAQFKNPAGQDVIVPDFYWYNLCLKEKGLQK